jgi:hypothetical protein
VFVVASLARRPGDEERNPESADPALWSPAATDPRMAEAYEIHKRFVTQYINYERALSELSQIS